MDSVCPIPITVSHRLGPLHPSCQSRILFFREREEGLNWLVLSQVPNFPKWLLLEIREPRKLTGERSADLEIPPLLYCPGTDQGQSPVYLTVHTRQVMAEGPPGLCDSHDLSSSGPVATWAFSATPPSGHSAESLAWHPGWLCHLSRAVYSGESNPPTW